MKEKSELNTLKAKRKIINCLEKKGYAAVDCDNQIDMVNRGRFLQNSGERRTGSSRYCTTEQRFATILIFLVIRRWEDETMYGCR